MKSLSFLFAPSGTCLSSVEEYLKSQGVKVFDVEDYMSRLLEVKEELSKRGRFRRTMLTLVWHSPVHKVKKWWRDAWNDLQSDLFKEENFDHAVIGGHAVYYSGQRNEFYSAVDLNLLKRLKEQLRDEGILIDKVIVLIDDIYDMYHRLTRPNEIFDFNKIFEKTKGLLIDEYDFTRDKEDIKLIVKHGILHKLLNWRQNEILISETISEELEARFIVFALKQRRSLLLKLISSTDLPIIYVSHPITRFRRDVISKWKKGVSYSWPRIVYEEINELPKIFETHNIILISPTAIDELRIALDILKLSPRWPVPGNTLWEADVDVNYTDFFIANHRDSLNNKAKILSLLSIAQIIDQLSARDHKLVFYADAILVYRPLCGANSFSGGVLTELDYWSNIIKSNETGKRPRLIYLHLMEDITQDIIKNEVVAIIRNEPVSIADFLKTKIDIHEDMIRQFLTRLTSSGRSSAVSPRGRLSPEEEKCLSDNAFNLMRETLRYCITKLFIYPQDILSDYRLRRSVSVIVLDDFHKVQNFNWKDEIKRTSENLSGIEKILDYFMKTKDISDFLKSFKH
ncbi:hypothetical protein J7L00_05165 [Candidatus Bathyarchaeota archaeon]|nr:hypothetical protein [Candidatus Bathyarchaeota archaeon]